jgi:O-antigen/teichoic acid export membrane protein
MEVSVAQGGHRLDSPTPRSRSDPANRYGRESIMRNALWRIIDSGGSELLSIVFFIVLGRLLTPADFGVVAIAGVFLLICQVILRTGFGVALIQRHRLEPAHLNSAFWANLGLAALLAALLIVAAVPLAAVLGEPSLSPVMAALAPTLLLSGAAWIFHARFRREMRYDVVVLSALAGILCGGLVGALMALSGAGVWSLVGQQVTGALLPLVVLVARSPWWPSPRFSGTHFRDLASFSVKVVAGQALDSASQRAIPLILAFFVTAHAVGLYVIASRLMWACARVTLYVIFDLSLVVLSRMSSEPERHREGAYYTLRIMTLVCLPLFVGAALIADPLIPLLFGAHWAESVLLFQILCLSSIFFALCFCAQQILISAGRPDPALRLATISAIAVPAFTLAAAPFGIVPATVAAGLAAVAVLPVALRLLRVEIGLRMRRLLVEQIPPWLAATAMALALWLVRWFDGPAMAHSAGLVAVQVACGAVVFFAVVLLVAPTYVREISSTLRDVFLRQEAKTEHENGRH